MTVFLDTSENFHPYECGGPGKCIHCDRRFRMGISPLWSHDPNGDHDPRTCALCDPNYDHMPNPHWKGQTA